MRIDSTPHVEQVFFSRAFQVSEGNREASCGRAWSPWHAITNLDFAAVSRIRHKSPSLPYG